VAALKILEKKSDIFENFIFSLYKKSENTRKTYAYIINQFKAAMPAVDLITVEHIEQYVFVLQKKHKPSSVNLAINIIKSFYGWLSAYNGQKNLGKYIKTLPALPPEQRVLTKDEYCRVCRVAHQPDLDCFRFLCNTGLRVSEFIALQNENVANGFLRVIGKGRRNRSIPLNAVSKEIYARNANFEMVRNRSRLWVFRRCKSLAIQAQIPTFHPHSCRHYFSNELYHSGVDMYTISRLLGHSSTMVTENVYVHWSEETLAGATDVLGKT